MKEVEVRAWCDKCYSDAEARSEAVTHKVTIGTLGPLELELCDLHDKELLEPLRQLLTERGSPPARKPPARPVVPPNPRNRPDANCPICGNRMLDTSITNHVYQVHGRLGPNDPRPAGRPEGVSANDWAVQWVRQQNGAV